MLILRYAMSNKEHKTCKLGLLRDRAASLRGSTETHAFFLCDSTSPLCCASHAIHSAYWLGHVVMLHAGSRVVYHIFCENYEFLNKSRLHNLLHFCAF